MLVGGIEVVPGTPEWQKIFTAYREKVDRAKFERIGDRLKYLTVIAEYVKEP
jgi:hypothetical protein